MTLSFESSLVVYRKLIQNILYLLIILCCFSINMPTAWMTIFSSLTILAWLMSGDFNKKFERMIIHPGAMITILLFLIYCLSLFYTSAPWEEGKKFILKDAKLLLIPIIISSINLKEVRSYGLNAFLVSSLIALSVSYAKWLNLLPMDLGIHDISSPVHGFVLFKNRIAHSILMSFSMYMMLIRANHSQGIKRIIWQGLGALAFFNVMHLVTGRSGQVIALGLLVFYFIKTFGKKALFAIILLSLFGFVFKSLLAPILPERLAAISQEITDAQQKKELTSSGIRLEMYKSVSKMYLSAPILGHGVGSLRNEYNKLVKDESDLDLQSIDNPHNQFLLTFFELGAFGGFILIAMFYAHWTALKKHLSSNESYLEELMQGLILTILIGCLFNSLLLDAGEGKFYCVIAGLILSAYMPRKKNHA
jgi:O-antigen ligase